MHAEARIDGDEYWYKGKAVTEHRCKQSRAKPCPTAVVAWSSIVESERQFLETQVDGQGQLPSKRRQYCDARVQTPGVDVAGIGPVRRRSQTALTARIVHYAHLSLWQPARSSPRLDLSLAL